MYPYIQMKAAQINGFDLGKCFDSSALSHYDRAETHKRVDKLLLLCWSCRDQWAWSICEVLWNKLDSPLGVWHGLYLRSWARAPKQFAGMKRALQDMQQISKKSSFTTSDSYFKWQPLKCTRCSHKQWSVGSKHLLYIIQLVYGKST